MADASAIHILTVAGLLALAVAVLLIGGAVFFAAILDDLDDGGHLDEPLYFDEHWDQPGHVTVRPGPYDWAADATDQGWGGPL